MNKDEQVNVAIGATSLVQPLTGIGQYTFNLAKKISERPGYNLDLFYGRGWSKDIEPRTVKNISTIKNIVRKVVPFSYKINRWVQQSAFDKKIVKSPPALYHEPNFLPLKFDGPVVITVHDLSFIRYPHTHPKERIKMMNDWFPAAVERADCIIADSHYTKSEILSEFAIESDKVKVVHLGASKDFMPRSKADVHSVLCKYDLKYRDYMLAVGTLEPRKNLVQVIEAYRALPLDVAKKTPLIIAGMRGWKEKGMLAQLEALLINGRARLLGYVPGEDLPYIYSGARGLLYPSIYEGFGLPVLEAMSSGTPVICSNSSSLPEVIGKAGKIVEIGDVDRMAELIRNLCEDEGELIRLAAAGLKRSSQFSWDKCATDTIEAYQYTLRKN